MVKSLKAAEYEVQVKIIRDGESRTTFCSALTDAGAEVCFYGKIYDQRQKISLLGSCDYGINMMKESVAVGLTIKSIDYFSMRLL